MSPTTELMPTRKVPWQFDLFIQLQESRNWKYLRTVDLQPNIMSEMNCLNGRKIYRERSRGGPGRKNLGGHVPWDKGEEKRSGGEAPENFFDHALFSLRKRPI